MSPKPRRPQTDLFADETTSRYDPSAVPQVVEDDSTLPVDVREMEAAARAAQLVDDPAERPRIIRRESSGGSARVPQPPPAPYAEVQVAGTAQVHALPAHNLSPTGIALEVPDGIDLRLTDGATVMLHLHLEEGSSGEPVQARLPARVAHLRPGRGDKPGGLALRWDTDNPRTAAEVDRLLTLTRRA